MSIQAVGWALEQELPRGPKLVLVSIANHANHVDGYCWLNATTIGREASCTPRSVYNIIGALVRNGFIRKELRRDDHGRQRANDYWLLFDREEKSWEWGTNTRGNEGDGEAIEDEPTEDDEATSCGQSEATSLCEEVERHEAQSTRQPAEMPAVSPGPSEVDFTRKRIAEPSKTNPKESSARARVLKSTLRNYRPPPPQPVGEVFDNAKQVFAYEGTRAYEAWAKVRARESGIRNWHLITKKLVDGKWRSGWYFPSLFPPAATGPPSELSEEDANAFTGE